uniref:Uncharacterized protein n=1 Tax=Megaselia scalaris TaxID=36166 RepID=T1GD46_MEGSC
MAICVHSQSAIKALDARWIS